MQITARRYDTLQPVTVSVNQGKIQRIELAQTTCDLAQVPWISPGFVDVQVNGYGGVDFNSPSLSAEDVARIGLSLNEFGVTRFCPTVTTDGFQSLRASLHAIANSCDQDPRAAERIAGIHLEGPYISPEDGPRGAHPRAHVRPPDWEEFRQLQDAAGGRIRLLTLSPEYEQAAEFIKQAVASGVTIAIGHTSANSDQIRSAVDVGATLSTHLGNGAHGQIRRHPNYIWDQLADDRLTASLIADGHHLPPEVVQVFVRAKSAERLILVSDITGMAGLPPGHYASCSLGAVEVLEDGRLVIAGQRQLLAGAALPITAGIANLLRYSDVDLAAAVKMASYRPAEVIGASQSSLQVGSTADLVLFKLPGADGVGPVGELNVVATLQAGELVYGKLDG